MTRATSMRAGLGGKGSIAHYSLGIANGIHPDANLGAGLTLTTSVVLGGIVTIGALVIAARRLATFAIAGDPA